MKKINERIKAYRQENPSVRLYGSLRQTLHDVLKKPGRTSAYVDYTPLDLKTHLEKLFKGGMSWENYGRKGWHVDHIRPLASFNFFDSKGKVSVDQVREAMSLKNLQPLWAAENIKKSDTFDLKVAV